MEGEPVEVTPVNQWKSSHETREAADAALSAALLTWAKGGGEKS